MKAERIGKTQNNLPLIAYFLNNSDKDERDSKSMILFTGAHHARELVTVNMIIKILLENMHALVHSKEEKYLKENILVFLPIINLDSHTLISESFGTPRWNKFKWKRKNMNRKFCGGRIVNSGVDLNRNYGFHYGESIEDLD